MCSGMRTTNYKNTLTVSILSIHTCKARSAKRLVSAAPHIGHTARKLISQRGLLNGRGARRPTITIIMVLMVMAGGRDNENKEGDMLMMTSVLLGKELTPIVWLSLHPFLLIRKYAHWPSASSNTASKRRRVEKPAPATHTAAAMERSVSAATIGARATSKDVSTIEAKKRGRGPANNVNKRSDSSRFLLHRDTDFTDQIPLHL